MANKIQNKVFDFDPENVRRPPQLSVTPDSNTPVIKAVLYKKPSSDPKPLRNRNIIHEPIDLPMGPSDLLKNLFAHLRAFKQFQNSSDKELLAAIQAAIQSSQAQRLIPLSLYRTESDHGPIPMDTTMSPMAKDAIAALRVEIPARKKSHPNQEAGLKASPEEESPEADSPEPSPEASPDLDAFPVFRGIAPMDCSEEN